MTSPRTSKYLIPMPSDAEQFEATQAVARATGIDLTQLLTALHAAGALIIPMPQVPR